MGKLFQYPRSQGTWERDKRQRERSDCEHEAEAWMDYSKIDCDEYTANHCGYQEYANPVPPSGRSMGFVLGIFP